MLRLTCDPETMKQITLDTQDFTNNQEAMEEIAKSDYKSDFLGGQNHVALFAEAATKIDMSNASDYDKDMNEDIQTSMHKYFDGELTYEEALDEANERFLNSMFGSQAVSSTFGADSRTDVVSLPAVSKLYLNAAFTKSFREIV